MVDPIVGFLGFLLTTVLLLVAVTLTGFLRRLALHLPLVVLTVASLVGSIYFALEVGTLYDLEAAGMITPIHLWLAKIATAGYLLPVATGLMTLRNRGHRSLHRAAAFIALGLTVAATVTGMWMLFAAERL
ncbi:MAG: hypothetical protein ACYTFV_16385 [Planctomycetota bacterium]